MGFTPTNRTAGYTKAYPRVTVQYVVKRTEGSKSSQHVIRSYSFNGSEDTTLEDAVTMVCKGLGCDTPDDFASRSETSVEEWQTIRDKASKLGLPTSQLRLLSTARAVVDPKGSSRKKAGTRGKLAR